MSLITRSGKGSKLTTSEMDANLTYLESLASIGASSSADISAVNAGTGLTGGGSTGAVTLSILSDGVTEDMLNIVGGPTAGYILSSDGTNLTWIQANPGDITGVNAGTGLTGGGLAGEVTLSLDIPNDYINEDMLNIVGGPTAGYVLSNDGTNLTWVESNPGDITGVAAGTGLTGGGLSGDVTLSVDSGYVALKSDLVNYLQLTGGTVSGTVSFGTGAKMIGSFTSGPYDHTNEIRLSGPGLPGPTGLELISTTPTFNTLRGRSYVSSNMISSQIHDTNTNNLLALSLINTSVFYLGVYDYTNTSNVELYGNDGKLKISANSTSVAPTYGAILSTDLLTAERDINFPDASGTLALTSDIGGVNLGNILYVSINGDNGTATKGLLTKPYLTIGNALSSAVAGDLVYVFPGTYSEHSIDIGNKDNISVYLSPGVTVESYTGNSIFKDISGNVINFKIYGSGKVFGNGDTGADQSPLQLIQSGSDIEVELMELNGLTAWNSTIINIKNCLITGYANSYENNSFLTFENCTLLNINFVNVSTYLTSNYSFRNCKFIRNQVASSDPVANNVIGNEACWTIAPSNGFNTSRSYEFYNCDFINTLSSTIGATSNNGISSIKIYMGNYISGSFVSLLNCKYYGVTGSFLDIDDRSANLFGGSGTEDTDFKYFLDGNITNVSPIIITDSTGITTQVLNGLGTWGITQSQYFKIVRP